MKIGLSIIFNDSGLENIAKDSNPYNLGGISVSKEMPTKIILAVYKLDRELLNFAVNYGYLNKDGRLKDLTTEVRNKMKEDYINLGGVVNSFYPSAKQLEYRKNLN